MKDKIKAIQEKLLTIERSKRYLEAVNRKLVVEKDKMDRLSILVDKEYQDLSKLTNESLARSVKNIFIKEDKSSIEKEKKEYLEAALLYKEEQKIEKMLLFEKGILEEKIKGEKALYAQLDYLKKEYRQWVIKRNPTMDFDVFFKQIEHKEKLLVELKEVIVVGTECQVKLDRIEALLKKITTSSHMHNGNLFSRNILTTAEQIFSILNGLRADFLRYDRELREVTQFIEIKGNYSNEYLKKHRAIYNIIQQTNHFTEHFIQRVISDFMVQRQLSKTLEFVSKINSEIGEIQEDLKEEKGRAVIDLKTLKMKEAKLFELE